MTGRHVSLEQIARAAELLRSGQLVAFPTETVYGLGANALDAAAVRKIYAAKGRPSTSPLIVHVANAALARALVTYWPPLAATLAAEFWPGPLTMVLPKQALIPDEVTAGLGTVGIRVPAHPVALALLEAVRIPVAAPSANRFTELSPTTAEHVRESFGDSIPVLDGGPCDVGIESTVLGIENGGIVVLRPGMISLDDLRAFSPNVRLAAQPVSGASHSSPGQHDRHYSPRTPLVLGPPRATGRGAYLEWSGSPRDAAAINVRMPDSPAGYAAALYGALHAVDGGGYDWIAVEPVPDSPEWDAIRDRLRRAASE
ncbi:MAG: L-threonylcarbamoyladenylate synthase [Bryobacteraceae bacterium]